MTFSRDGKFLAWNDGRVVYIASIPSCNVKFTVNKPRTSCIHFSPQGNFIALWESYTASKELPHGNPNLDIWTVKEEKLLHSFIQKKQSNWKPQWSDNEELCARNVSNEIHFFEDNKFDKITKKMFAQKVSSFTLSPGSAPYHVASYTPGVKGQPSFVTLHRYPNFEGNSSVIARKSFYKSDFVDYYWNNSGDSIVVMASTDVDKSGASYYGEQALYFMSTNGDSSMIKLLKDGPIYSIEWSPLSNEFCVVYGSMPAKATIFNKKCEPVYDFGTGPRNAVYYNPHGHMLILAGFGNLRGNVEVWSRAGQKIVTISASDTTFLSWCPDGEHILTGTVAPRIRIGNGYKIWHYTGSLLHELMCDIGSEMWDLCWQPFPPGTFPKKTLTLQPVHGIQSSQPEASKQVYRPPAARGQPSTIKLREDYEPPSDLKPKINIPIEGLSKSALKNKKKKQAKKAKKEQEKGETVDDDEKEEKVADSIIHPSIENVFSEDPEKNKKIKNLSKKLDQISKLKEQQRLGKPLELNQLEKIKKENELLEELKLLQL
ncbi:eukaryotic translation initiation factor 2A-like [Centruroides vittatus]|uniref:eukaryotic translation initiation factor 2A-like n=1 Tax=Centruroides vittatus TaxID=120091 RepID=UPI0035100E67